MMRRTDILEKCLEVKHYHNYPDTISQYSDTQTDRQDFITKQNSENLEVSDVCEQSCKHFLRLLSCMPLEQWKQYAYKVLTKSLIFSASPHFQIPYWYCFIDLKICRKIKICREIRYLNMISHNAALLKTSMNTASNGTCILILVYPIKIVQYQTPSSYDQPRLMVQTQIDLQQ